MIDDGGYCCFAGSTDDVVLWARPTSWTAGFLWFGHKLGMRLHNQGLLSVSTLFPSQGGPHNGWPRTPPRFNVQMVHRVAVEAEL